MSTASDILAKAALALREIDQHELADIVTLLGLLGTVEHIATVRGAVITTTLRAISTQPERENQEEQRLSRMV
jgi:hypothetical protein